MEGAFAWLGQVVEWVGRWIPRLVVIRSTFGGVKWVRGAKVVPLGPGLHVYWPLVTDFEEFPTARQTDELRAQTITTVDGRTVLVSGLLVYRVEDIGKLLGQTHQPVLAIQDIALTAIHDVCCLLKWDELQDEQRNGKLDRALRREMKKALEAYGVQVEKVALTDLSPVRVIRLLQTTSQASA